MWPTLVQSETTRNRKSRARELIGWARTEEENDGLQALVTSPSSETDTDAKKKSRMQREMEELGRWLESEDPQAERRREDRKSTRLNSSHSGESRMPSSA